MRAGAYSWGMVGETANQKGCRPPTFGWSILIALKTHPPWAWGSTPDPLRDTSAFMQPGLGVMHSIAPLWPPEPTMEGAGWGEGVWGVAAGRQQADQEQGIGAVKRLALKRRNCRI